MLKVTVEVVFSDPDENGHIGVGCSRTWTGGINGSDEQNTNAMAAELANTMSYAAAQWTERNLNAVNATPDPRVPLQ